MKFPWIMNRGSSVGVDIGLHSVKVAQLKVKHGQPEIIGFANSACEMAELDTEGLAIVLAEVFSQINYQGESVTATLSGEQLITRIVDIPIMSDSELETTIFYEATGLLPSAAADWIIRHTVLNPNTDNQGLMQVLLIAAPRQQVLLYYQAFKMAGIKLTAIDIPYYAIWRLYAPINSINSYLIVNLDIDNAELIVVRQNVIQHLRSIRLSKDNIINELERYLEIYHIQQQNYPIKQIILTGEISNMTATLPLIEQALAINVEIGRPWMPINDVTKAQNVDLAGYSTAIGLALREVGD